MDILKTDFKQGFKGYNVEEVDAFVTKVVGQYETLMQENKKLEEKITDLEAQLTEYQNKEQDIHGLIALTRETVSEAKIVVNQQVEGILEEANLQAKLIIDKAEAKARDQLRTLKEEVRIQQDQLRELHYQEKRFKERIRQLMENIWEIMESAGKAVEPVKDISQTQVYQELGNDDADFELD